MTDDIEYFDNKKADKTYISKRIVNPDLEGRPTRPVRIASHVFDPAETYVEARVAGQAVLRVTAQGREEVKATFYEDDRRLRTLVIQRFTKSSGTPQKGSFSFSGVEIPKLLQFLDNIRKYQFPDESKVNIPDSELRKIVTSGQLNSLLNDNQDALIEFVRSGVTKSDVKALGYRKAQLERFRKLLYEPAFFQSEAALLSKDGEALWQDFFEQNKWIFGYGLTYVSLTSLDQSKLERIVLGSDVSGRGKRTDALMKTKGAIESLCFVEIKKHDTALLQSGTPYRPACWAPSKELAGGITQSQVTVEMSVRRLAERLEPTRDDGTPTGEHLFSYHPRSILVVGSLEQFRTEAGINTEQYRSFELLRRHTIRPEIITFDELYERAKFIVANEDEATPPPVYDDEPIF
jgi:hypothetical protein